MKPDYIHELCTTTESIASEYAKDTSQELGSLVKKLRKEWTQHLAKKDKATDGKQTGDRLELAASCGKFAERPSDLFLKVRRQNLWPRYSHEPTERLVIRF